MISISLTTAILIYSLLLGAIFLVLYLYTEMDTRRSHRVLAEQYVWRCVYCGFTYLDEAAEAVSECPRCHSYNAGSEGRPRAVRSKAESPARAVDDAEPRRNPSRRKRPHQRRRGPRRR